MTGPERLPSQGRDGNRWVRRTVHRGTGHQHVGSGGYRLTCGVGIDPSIHLQIAVRLIAVDIPADRLQLGKLIGHELLSAEAGLHRHHQHQLHTQLQVGEHRFGRGDGPQDDPPLHPALLHAPEGLPDAERHIGLQVDREQIGAGVGKGIHIAPRLFHHQMDVQKHLRVPADGRHHRHADGDVGHEHAVHHVHMEPVGGIHPPDLPLQIAKIR